MWSFPQTGVFCSSRRIEVSSAVCFQDLVKDLDVFKVDLSLINPQLKYNQSIEGSIDPEVSGELNL